MNRRDIFPNFYAALDAIRWLGRIMRPFALALAFLLLLAFVTANLSAGRALEAELQRIRAAGEPLSLHEAAPPPLPDSENAAPLYERAFQRLPRLEKDRPGDGASARHLARADEQILRPFASGDSQEWREVSLPQVQQALAGTGAALALTRKAAAMPRCRFPVDWDAGAGALFPHLPRLRTLSELLAAHAMVAAAGRQPSEAAADIEAILGIARHVYGEPVLIGQVVGYSCLSLAGSTEQRLLEIAPPNEAECRRLDQAWSEIDLRAPFERSLEGERCFGLWAFNLIATDPDKLSALIGVDDPLLLLPRRLGPLGPWLRKRDESEYLRRIGNEIAWEKEHESLGLPGPAEDDLSAAWDTPVTHCLLPAFNAARRNRGITAARIALARWGLAIAIYRERTGHLPETLSAVEEKVGWRLPADPFTGTDLRYRLTTSGYVLYSVGPNRRDDNGQSWTDKAHAAAEFKSGAVPAKPTSAGSADDVAWWFGS